MQILPSDVGWHAGLNGSFTIIEFSE
ncbi:hypothetical protein [Salinispora vitiensis]